MVVRFSRSFREGSIGRAWSWGVGGDEGEIEGRGAMGEVVWEESVGSHYNSHIEMS